MDFSEKLIIGDTVEGKEEIVSLIEDGARVFEIYLVCINTRAQNVFEIIKSAEIHKPVYKGKNYRVVGVANSKKESIQIIEALLKEFYSRNTGEGLKKYFLRKY